MRHIVSTLKKAVLLAGLLCSISIPTLAKDAQDHPAPSLYPVLSTIQECVWNIENYWKTETRHENGMDVTVMHLHPARPAEFPLPQLLAFDADDHPVLRFSPVRDERPDPVHPDLRPLSLS